MNKDVLHLKEICSHRSVLYVEDEEALRNSIGMYLEKFFKKVILAVDGVDGLDKFNQETIDLVITDISMPKKDGLEMAEEIKAIKPKQEVMIISAYSEAEYFLDAIRIGVDGFILKPVEFLQMNTELLKIMSKIEMLNELEAYNTSLQKMVEEKTQREHALELEKIENQKEVMMSLVELIEKRDSYTAGHSRRVANYCKVIAEKIGYNKAQCELIYEAGILHDIGKIGIPDTVLLKPGVFSEQEYHLIKKHVELSVDVLKKVPMYKDIVDIIAHHHERFDGKGYPQGLKGNDIPPLARIMIVADAFDAMTTNRIYKGRKSIPEALEELKSLSSIQFHPEVVDVVVEALSNIVIDTQINQIPQSELEKERFSYFYKDQITGAYNQTYLDSKLMECKIKGDECFLYAINLHDLGSYNKKFGWSKGDELLTQISSFLQDKYSNSILFRVHGDRFVLFDHTPIDNTLDELSNIELLQSCSVRISGKQIHSGLMRDIDINELTEKIYA